jgi:peptidyl-prolyl cis-trans isomerase A (cyclophilin A)
MLQFFISLLLLIAPTGEAPAWENCCWKKTESGLKYKIESPGNGSKIIAGEECEIVWVWYKKNGMVIENMLNQEGHKWKAKSGMFVRGFEEGLMLLNRGGSAFIKIPAQLAYGKQGRQGEKTFCYYIKILE